MDDRDFRAAVGKAVLGERWVVDGSYRKVQDLVLERATTVIWLNYPFLLAFARALRRTIARILRKEALFSGNRESFRVAFLSRESLLWWIIRTHRGRRKRYRELLTSGCYHELEMLEFHDQRETEGFLGLLKRTNGRSNLGKERKAKI